MTGITKKKQKVEKVNFLMQLFKGLQLTFFNYYKKIDLCGV